jgi:proline iminopeptidase
MTDQRFEVDAASIWVSVRGAGPPLLLLHGGPGLWSDFDGVIALVDDLATVATFDQRGCGRSTGSGPYTLRGAIADIEAVREHLGYEHWTVGGHSWGAALALAYALAHPERTSALLYISGTGIAMDWRTEYRAERARRLTLEQQGRLDALPALRDAATPGSEEWATLDDEANVLAWSRDFADRSRAVELATGLLRPGLHPNFEANRALMADWDAYLAAGGIEERLRALDVPALVIHGDGDPRPASAVDPVAAALPRGEFALIEGAGHFPWIEQPDAFRGVLRGFLARL